jgi:CBS domain-containing protein
MSTVRKLLEGKTKKEYIAVSATDSVLQALKIMTEARIGAVLVKEGGKIVGIYTERDYLQRGELEGRVAKDTLIREVMTPRMITVTRDTSVDECIALMKQYEIRHLPVVEDKQVVGIVSIRDILFAALSDRESEIRGLENYILGSNFQS